MRDATGIPAGIDGRELDLSAVVGELDTAQEGFAGIVLCTQIAGFAVFRIIAILVAMPDVYAGVGENGAIRVGVDHGECQAEGNACFAFGDIGAIDGRVAAEVVRVGAGGLRWCRGAAGARRAGGGAVRGTGGGAGTTAAAVVAFATGFNEDGNRGGAQQEAFKEIGPGVFHSVFFIVTAAGCGELPVNFSCEVNAGISAADGSRGQIRL